MFNILLKKAAQLVFPPFCEWCRTVLLYEDLLCETCKKNIKPIVAHKISLTQTHDMWVHAVGAYQDPLKYLIVSKRWSYHLASVYLGKLMWQYGSVSMLNVDYITSIPLHWSRQSWRGYNQAAVMAQEIARYAGVPYIESLQRIKSTPFQSRYTGEQREENVKHVFHLKDQVKDILFQKHILLVDDLMTTGSTLKFAAKELLKGRPSKISAAVVARVT